LNPRSFNQLSFFVADLSGRNWPKNQQTDSLESTKMGGRSSDW